jgi:hypothetical protein
MGSIWADIDNDGDEDVLVYKWGRCELFQNRGGESFERITDSAGLPAWANIGAATWLDYDRDGLVDLFLAGYWPTRCGSNSSSTPGSCRRALSTPRTAGGNGCCGIWGKGGLKT